MGNIIGSLFSGVTKVIGDLLGSPLDFLSGKSCSSVCGSRWDFICYIENFCVANLLKMVMVLGLLYIVLLFFYLLFKLGICGCVAHGLCKMIWAGLVCWFSLWEYSCIFLCEKLIMLKRIRRERRRDFVEFDSSEEDCNNMPIKIKVGRSLSHRMRDCRGLHLRKSLRPRSHRIRVGLSRDSDYGHERSLIKHGNHAHTVHSIRVSHTSRFVRKGTNLRGKVYRRSRW